MGRFIARRLASMVVVMFAVSVLVFLIFNVIPNGDPAVRMAGRQPTETQIEAIREEWGFDEPVYVQYLTTMEKLFTGDMVSYFTQLNVVEEIRKGIPRTLSLAIGAAIIWMAFAVGLGVYSAMRAGQFSDRLLTVFALIGISMPVFWIGAMMNQYLGFELSNKLGFELFPNGGYVEFTEREPVRVVPPSDLALDRARDPVHRCVLAGPARKHSRHDERGLRPHREGQGALRAPDHDQARPAQLAGPDRHALGP